MSHRQMCVCGACTADRLRAYRELIESPDFEKVFADSPYRFVKKPPSDPSGPKAPDLASDDRKDPPPLPDPSPDRQTP